VIDRSLGLLLLQYSRFAAAVAAAVSLPLPSAFTSECQQYRSMDDRSMLFR